MYESEVGKMKLLISNECNEAIPSLSFTCDGWSSRTLDKYLSFTISFINNDFVLRALALENKPISGNQTADVIIESLERSMELLNLPKAVQVGHLLSEIMALILNRPFVDQHTMTYRVSLMH